MSEVRSGERSNVLLSPVSEEVFLSSSTDLQLVFPLQALRLFIPDPTDKAQIESMMLNICGRVIEDDELYDDMGDKTDKEAQVPFWARNVDIIQVSKRVLMLVCFSNYEVHIVESASSQLVPRTWAGCSADRP